MRPAIASGIVNGPGTHWSAIGPLQLAIYMVQNRHAGEQKSHWDKTNKTYIKAYIVLNGNFLYLPCPCSATFALQGSPAWRFFTM